MPIIGDASVVVDADTRPFDKNFRDGAEKSATGVGNIIKGVLGAQLIQRGAAIGVGIFKDAITEGREAQKVGNLTAAVLKSTGEAAGVTGKQVGDLANKLSVMAGVDDEVVQASENVLLTFTNIKNATGKNNDVFNQAETAALNLSKALGTDLQGATIQVGKALNDPIKGVTALQRVGVSFTASQKEQIKTLVDSGKTMDAQKLILGELNKEFGGAAAASTNAGERLGVVFKNIEQTIGLKLLPIIDAVAQFLADKLPGALDAAGRGFAQIQSVIEPVIQGVQQVINVLFKGDFTGGGPFAEDAPFITSLFQLRDKWLPVLKDFGTFLSDNMKPILIGVGAALLVVASPLVALGAAFVVAYTKSEAFRDIVNAAIESAAKTIGGLIAFVQKNLPAFEEAFTHVANVVIAVFNQMKGTIEPILQGVLLVVSTVFNAVIGIIEQAVAFIANIINGNFSAAFGNLKKIVSIAIGAAITLIEGLPGKVLAAAGNLAGTMVGIGVDMLKGMIRGIQREADNVINAIKRYVLDKIPGFVKHFFGISSPSKMFAGFGANLMEGMAQGIRGAAGSPLDALAAATSQLSAAGTANPAAANAVGTAQSSIAAAQSLVGQIVIQGATFEGANATAAAVLRELRGEAFRQGK